MSVPADPRWLEILKASGWQTAAFTGAAAFLLYGNSHNWFELEPWIIEAAIVVLIVAACLTVASIGSAAVKASKGSRTRLAQLWTIRQIKHQVAKGIPQMTDKDREIIAYLLAKNQSMFTSTPDGGHANTLISKGIIVCALLPGQAYTEIDVPFRVPDYIWDVLLKHKAEFPYTPPKAGETKPYPWRVSWMLR
jgi:hypothetical protein